MKTSYSATEKKYLKKFGERVRSLRKAKGFSQEDFALEIELDRTYMGGIERGERNVALLNILKIAKGLEITARELFSFPFEEKP